jgi:hypothetical protein
MANAARQGTRIRAAERHELGAVFESGQRAGKPLDIAANAGSRRAEGATVDSDAQPADWRAFHDNVVGAGFSRPEQPHTRTPGRLKPAPT